MLAIIAGTLGTISGFGFFIQSFKLISRKSAQDISYTTFLLVLVTSAAWVAYGVQANNLPLTIANSVGAAGSATVILLTFHYNKVDRANQHNARSK